MRLFKQDLVPENDLNDILTTAGYAPSNCNTQPWKICIVRGARAESMKQVLLQNIGQGNFQLDFPFDDSLYVGEYKNRQRSAGKLYFDAAGISRDNQAQRAESLIQNLSFYGAPQAAFIFMPDWAGVREAADVGMYAQNLMLALRERNIGSCPQTVLGFNADAVRKELDISSEWKLLFGISFGYFDASHPLNQVRTSRVLVGDSVEIF